MRLVAAYIFRIPRYVVFVNWENCLSTHPFRLPLRRPPARTRPLPGFAFLPGLQLFGVGRVVGLPPQESAPSASPSNDSSLFLCPRVGHAARAYAVRASAEARAFSLRLLDVGFNIDAGVGGKRVKSIPVFIGDAGNQRLSCFPEGKRPFGCSHHPAASLRVR